MLFVKIDPTEDGTVRYDTKNIEDIQTGDLVYSYNTLTGETELCKVTSTVALSSDHLNYLTIVDKNGNEQVIETTDSHPFLVVTDDPDLDRAARSVVDENGISLYHENVTPTEHGYWVEAKDLRVGDVFLGVNGELSTLKNIVHVEQEGGIQVFNFTVEGNHNYYVITKEYDYSQTSVLVHNATNYINPNDAARIQRTANEIKQPIHVVGSRASGTATSLSDWDYVIEGAKSKARSTARRTLPKGIAGGEISPSGYETGIDVFTEPLDTLRPHVTFYPR